MLAGLDFLSVLSIAAAYVVVLIAARLTVTMFGEEIKDVFGYIGNEIRATLRAKPTLKALNAYGMTFLFLIIVLAGYAGIAAMPVPSAMSTAYDIALLENGARAFYIFVFLLGFLLCVLLTRYER